MSKIYVLQLTKNKTVYKLKSTLLFLCICFINSNISGQTIWMGLGSLTPNANATTNFNFAGNWSTGKVPTATDNVVIDTPHTVTVDVASQAKSINLKGILNYLAPFVLSLGQ